MKAFARIRQLGTLMALLALPAVLPAQEFTYADTGNGTCTITGYTGPGGDVIIPSAINDLQVTGIGCQAFFLCTSLTSVVIPNSVTCIHRYAFWDCTNLATILIGNGTATIGDYAFYTCTSLTGVYFIGNAPSIGASAFVDDGAATVYYLPGAAGWGAPVFGGRPAVMCVPLSPYLYADHGDGTCTITGYIGDGGDLAIPGTLDGLTVTSIGDEAFYAGRSLAKVTIPDNVRAVGKWAFWNCGGLGRVTVGAGVTNIGSGAFCDCDQLAQVYFRGNGPSFGADVFAGSDQVMAYCLAGTANWGWLSALLPVVTYSTTNGAAAIVRYSCVGCTMVSIDTLDGLPVTSIGDHAFQNCACLTCITIPASVTAIGDGAFAACFNLTDICFQGNAPSLGADVFVGDDQATVSFQLGTTGWGASFGDLPTAMPGWAFADNGDGTCTITAYTGDGGDVSIPGLIDGLAVTRLGDGAFNGCQNLTGVTFPVSVTAIGAEPFNACVNLAAIAVDTNNPAFCSVDGVLFDKDQATLIQYPVGAVGAYTIPASVTAIGDCAFSGCAGLSSLTISAGITSIGHDPFGACTALSLIAVDTGNPAYSSVDGVLFDKGQTTLIQCPAAMEGSYAIPAGVTSIEAGAFNGCSSLTSVAIPVSVTSIGNDAFAGCESLTNVVISASVTTIGNNAFASCYSLTSVALPGNVSSIGDNAFADCESLTSVTIPASVTSIGNNAFSDCYSLTSVALPASVTNIGDNAFADCENLASVALPAGVTSIGDNAFSDCYSLASVTIPAGVTSLGDWTFSCCFNLASVYFKGHAPSLGGPNVFAADDGATVYYQPGTAGWNTFGYGKTVLWNPQVVHDASFGTQLNQFGFTVTNAGNPDVVIEASASLVNPVWTPVATNTLTGGASHFDDIHSANYPARFYRFRTP